MTVRVLIVDDEALVRTGLRLMLGAEPDLDVVGEATDGTTGVEKRAWVVAPRSSVTGGRISAAPAWSASSSAPWGLRTVCRCSTTAACSPFLHSFASMLIGGTERDTERVADQIVSAGKQSYVLVWNGAVDAIEADAR